MDRDCCRRPWYFVCNWMLNLRNINKLLDTYSFEEILELNEVTEADALLFLVEEEFVVLPDIKPVDYYDPSS